MKLFYSHGGSWLIGLGAAQITVDYFDASPMVVVFSWSIVSICSALMMLGGILWIGVETNAAADPATNKPKGNSGGLFDDARYAHALQLALADQTLENDVDDRKIQLGIDYLVNSGIEAEDARMKFDIVVGTFLIKRHMGSRF